jgi:hypothetical protein
MTNYEKLIASGKTPSKKLKELYEYSQECQSILKSGKKRLPDMPKLPNRKQCDSAERVRRYRERKSQNKEM